MTRLPRLLLMAASLVALAALVAVALAQDPRAALDITLVVPAGSLAAGALLALGTESDRDWFSVTAGALVLVVTGFADAGWLTAVALGTATAGETWLLARIVGHGTEGRPGLRTFPDALVVLLGALAATGWRLAMFVGVHAVGAALGAGEAAVVAASGFAGTLVALPPFLRLAGRPRAASVPEAAAYWVGVPAFALLVFLPGGRPELMFGIVTLLAWLAFRIAMCETVLHTALVAVIAISATAYGSGPVHALVSDSGFSEPRALVVGYAFVTACALCALPLSVMMADQYA